MTKEELEFFENLFGGSLDKGFGYQYNLFACEEGIKIANALKTKERITDFRANYFGHFISPFAEFVNLSDEHSGNTFEMACAIAICYLPMIRDQKISKIIEDENKNNI